MYFSLKSYNLFPLSILSRLAGLEPIVDRVLEFEALKNSLEEWCVEQQEVIEQLPPLEITEEQLLQQRKESSALLEGIVAKVESLQQLEDIVSHFFRDTEVCMYIYYIG